MKRACKADDFISPLTTMNTGEFKCSLICLRPTVGHEYFLSKRAGHQDFCKIGHGLRIIKIRDMNEFGCLMLYSLSHLRVTMAKAADCDSGEKIKILCTVTVSKTTPFTFHHHRWISCICPYKNLIRSLFQLRIFTAHQNISVPTPSGVNISSKIECSTRPSTI